MKKEPKNIHTDLAPAYQKSRVRIVERLMNVFAVFFLFLAGFGVFVAVMMGAWPGWIMVIGCGGMALLFRWINGIERKDEETLIFSRLRDRVRKISVDKENMKEVIFD